MHTFSKQATDIFMNMRTVRSQKIEDIYIYNHQIRKNVQHPKILFSSMIGDKINICILKSSSITVFLGDLIKILLQPDSIFNHRR